MEAERRIATALQEALDFWKYWEMRARELERRVDYYEQRGDAMAGEIEKLREKLRSVGAL